MQAKFSMAVVLLLETAVGTIGGGNERGPEHFRLEEYAIALHRAEFLNIDHDQNSQLDFYELQEHFKAELKPGADLVLDDIECFVEDLDTDFDGRVSWSEYLASLQQQQFDVPLTDLGE